DEPEFLYDVNSPNGPNHWGEINPEWSLCNNGDMQSPIDLTHKRVMTTSKLGRLDIDYKPANTTLINSGHDMALNEAHWHTPTEHTINGQRFNLELHLVHQSIDKKNAVLNQAHWHTPTEYTINGQRFNLELHLVHQIIDKKNAVVGILYKLELAATKDVKKSVGTIEREK
ncbi:hypothetical protein M8C21_020915, partial [Ambrosia artemisiifolia]